MSRRHDRPRHSLRAFAIQLQIDALARQVTEEWDHRLEGDAPPISLGRYQLDRVCGRGSFGVVFAGFDGELERDVAIKVCVEPELSVYEARALARLDHPNIVTLYDIGREQDFGYLVLELIDGWSLSQHRQAGLDWHGCVELFVQAGRGLAAAHRANFAHGDVKPNNMLVGRDGRVRVIDFGLAHLLAGIDQERQAPCGGAPEYRAPEHWTGAVVDGQRADQFSFCVSLWEALYGRRPWESTKVLATTDAPAPEADPGRSVPAWLEQVVRRGLAREPGDRYPCLNSLLADLEPAIHVHPQEQRATP